MKDKKIYQDVANTFTEKPKFTITVPVSWLPEVAPLAPVRQSLFNRLLNGKAIQLPPPPIETERTYTIYPCKVANMARIAGASIMLPEEILTGSLTETVLPLIPEHLPTIVYLVASGIQNNHEEPAPELIQFIERNFDGDDLYACLFPVLENMRMQAFLNSIVLAKGTESILKPKTSPNDRSE